MYDSMNDEEKIAQKNNVGNESTASVHNGSGVSALSAVTASESSCKHTVWRA